MVANGGRARRWGAYAAFGITVALLGQATAAQPPHPGHGAGDAGSVANQAPKTTTQPSAPVPIERDVERVASALESKNTYDQSTKGQQDAHEAAKAATDAAASARDAANWAGGMLIAAWAETTVTLVGVILVGATLVYAKKSAEAASDATVEMGKTAKATKDAAWASEIAARNSVTATTLIRENTRAELRAYIALEGIDFEWTDTHAAVVQVSWKNNGATPTVRALTQTNVRMEDSDMPEGFEYPDVTRDKPVIVSLGPGQHRNFHTNEKIHVVDIENVQSGYKHIHVWGWIEYCDVFDGKIRHRSEFCSVLKTLGKKAEKVSYVWNSYGPFNGTDGDCYRKPTT